MADDLIYLNGIDGASGEYLTPPLTPADLTRLALGETISPAHQSDLEDKASRSKTLGVMWDVNPTDLSSAGWGVIFARDADPRIQTALGELLELRRAQANATNDLYRLYVGADGYQPDESKVDWLTRHGMGPGPAEPDKVPYYLLIVGSPQEIPYTFQYQLDVQYAVGRIHFDSPEEYARYARSVVEAESGKLALPRRAAFFGTQNPDDRATDLSATQLLQPLADKMRAAFPAWSFSTDVSHAATKARVSELLGGKDTPALLFTASHGMAFPKTDKRQREHQGALLCQDYPGPLQWHGALPQDFYFAGDDLARDARMLGLISFHVACYGAGTPQVNDFPYLGATSDAYIPDQPFVARLPQRLLGHPNGGALAAISHVERAWGYSFFWDGAASQTGVYQSVMGQLMKGYPVGYALEFMNERYAELSTEVSAITYSAKVEHKTPNDRKLAELWTASNDARSYILLGDPAVRLNLSADTNAPAERPTITLVDLPTPPDSAAAAPTTPATPAIPSVTVIVTPPTGAENLNLLDDLRGAPDKLRVASDNLRTALENFANNLGDLLQRTVDDVTRLEVGTYVSNDMTTVAYDYKLGKLTGDVELRALTTMRLDGDTFVCIPRRAGDVDEALWKIHNDTVEQAQHYRAEILKAAVSAAAGLLDALKPAG